MINIEQIKKILRNNNLQKIVFPEGDADEIVQVAKILKNDNLIDPILLIEKDSDFVEGLTCINVASLNKDDFAQKLFDLRKPKIDLDKAKELIKLRTYYGTMMIKEGEADGMVCGLTFTTADTLRPALQIIKTSKEYSIASSVFIMSKKDENYLFTDCALNVDPNENQLVDIARMASDFAVKLGVLKPEVAMLSYSTNNSGMGPTVEKVKNATSILKKIESKDVVFEGPLQFDSAFDKKVRDKKFPENNFTKNSADVYVFPDLNSGNIGCKIAQRFGKFDAIGPFMLGLKKPINDLSRGATVNDILGTVIITAFQCLMIKENK
ncbi:phosphotransacetylase [Spiroplasma sp. TIUS-1]|uniref:phosphate acetyltransferase n=1 Tax=Spiroplasma sp. TIUS-1 TaxID=216963 RepID=UPI00139821F5|nr:phosphate acetyltransferase [Spiroplasma sp. TIUS-1]QHX35659.1 phosphotransacetylase [Spiroplasma sp. TIUS-1]